MGVPTKGGAGKILTQPTSQKSKQTLDFFYFSFLFNGYFVSAMYLDIPDEMRRTICNVICLDLASQLQSHSNHRNIGSLPLPHEYFNCNCSD